MKDLSLNVLDITHNSISAEASLIELEVAEENGTITITIKDNGKGIDPEMLETVTDPFTTSRTTRKVGMGLPLFKMAAEQTGGSLEIESTIGIGTKVQAIFYSSHIDCPPLGDMAASVAMLAGALKDGSDLVYTRSIENSSFAFDTRQIKEVLGEGISLAEPAVQDWIREYITQQEDAIKGDKHEKLG